MPDHRALARTLLELAEATFAADGGNPWAAGTALEACVALDDAAGALEWAERYVTHEYTDAFEVGSTLRQLTQLWQLGATTSELGGKVLLALQSGMLRMADGAVDLSAAEVRATPGLRRRFGLGAFVSFPWYARGLQRARGVACITDGSGTAVGTGFLMPGREVAPRWEQEPWVLLTSDHVVNDQGRQGLKPEEAFVSFEALTRGKRAELHPVDAVLWGSRPSRLDVAVLRLRSLPRAAEHLKPFRVAGLVPEPAPAPRAPRERVYVIGHPRGGRLRFSIHDNRLLARDESVIHYRTPTEPGSSGSPVFNRSWELIGIHHADRPGIRRLNGEGGRYDAHEGISIAAIRRAIEDELRDQPPS
jgi:S1-C subfamily serine protease